MDNTDHRRVVVVDDDAAIVSMIKAYLEEKGFTVGAFDNPDKAVNDICSNYADIVISDFNMPGMNGLELLEKAESFNHSTKGILISADPGSILKITNRYRVLDKSANLLDMIGEEVAGARDRRAV